MRPPSAYAAIKGCFSCAHPHGWSPEWRVGRQGIGTIVKQWQLGFWQPAGQLHSEQRRRHWVWGVQQNHSPDV